MGDIKKSINFTLRGKSYNLSLESVTSAMNGVKPNRITKYYVDIGGDHYPPKQILSEALLIPRISFTTKDAYDILTRLGLKVKE